MIGFAVECNTKDQGRDDMRAQFNILIICNILLLCGQPACAQEDYAECKARCAQLYSDCTNEPPAEEPELQAAKESTCNQKTELCNSDCENRKPVLDTVEPEGDPNTIRK